MSTSPMLEVLPKIVKEGDNIILEGSGWCDCPIKIEIDNETIRDIRIAQGLPVPDGVLPDSAAGSRHDVNTRNTTRQPSNQSYFFPSGK